MKGRKIYELPISQHFPDHMDAIAYYEGKHVHRTTFKQMFDKIKEEALKEGMTVEMTDERIMFIKGKKT